MSQNNSLFLENWPTGKQKVDKKGSKKATQKSRVATGLQIPPSTLH